MSRRRQQLRRLRQALGLFISAGGLALLCAQALQALTGSLA